MEPIPWRGFRAIDKLIFILLPLLAVSVAVLPLLDQIFIRRLARLIGSQTTLSYLVGGGAWGLAAGIVFLLAIYVIWRRHGLVSNRALWFGTGCPNCRERELVRVSRRFGDRFYNLAAVPAYRYACRNCTWRGLRIGRRERSADRQAELEAALLRFDPDMPMASTPAGAEPPRAGSEHSAPVGDGWDEPADHTPVYANGSGGHVAGDTDDGPGDDTDWLWPRPSGTDQV